MSVTEELTAPAWRAQIAKPSSGFCSGCLRGDDADAIFVDLGTPSGRGFIRELGSMAVVAELSQLCLCDACVREMAECLAFEPTLHRSHLAKLREVMAERDRLKDENRRLRAVIAQDGEDDGAGGE